MKKLSYTDNNPNTTTETFYNEASKLLKAMTSKDLIDYVSYDTWINPFREIHNASEDGKILIVQPMKYVERNEDYLISLSYEYNVREKKYWLDFVDKKGE